MAQNQEYKESTISISVRNEDRSWVIELDVATNESIQSVKTKIYEEKGITVDEQRLTFAGRELITGRTILDYNIEDRSELYLLTPMPREYSPSFSNGIYGCYAMIDVNAPIAQEIQEDIKEEKIDYRAQIQQEIRTITSQPDTPRDAVFELAKKVYRDEGKPVVIDKDDALSDIKQNAANYKNVALPMTLAMDKDFSTWNEQQFKQDFAVKFNVPIECIKVVSVRAGSIIANVELHTHWTDKNGHKKSMDIKVIADKVDPVVAKKAFAEFAVFAVEFKAPKAGFDCIRRQVIMNPKWNKTYGPGATNWDGALSDGKDRGGEPYYCPKGWKRFSIQFKESALDFANVYDKWPIAYHGTKFDFSMMITLSGLKCFPGAYGCGVYMSPSINYCAHDRYAKAVKLDFSKYENLGKDWSSDHEAEFRKYDGKWIQCAFALRVKPGSYTKNRDTMNLKQDPYDGIKRDEIIWCVNGAHEEIITDDKVLIYGIMIKVSDTEPRGHVYN